MMINETGRYRNSFITIIEKNDKFCTIQTYLEEHKNACVDWQYLGKGRFQGKISINDPELLLFDEEFKPARDAKYGKSNILIFGRCYGDSYLIRTTDPQMETICKQWNNTNKNEWDGIINANDPNLTFP